MNQPGNSLPRLYTSRSQIWRKTVQVLFLATVLLIGVQFTVFVNQLSQGRVPVGARPPGVEAFLPISALISLKYWVVAGEFNRIHPAGLLIFMTVLATGLFLKRGFCSWVCPVGLLGEFLNGLHRRLFRRNLRLPRWLDFPLRSLKYMLLGFFLWVIVLGMDAASLEQFIYSPYNRVADIKMLRFFQFISGFALGVLAVLTVFSVLFRNFWCRYLCPYGALLGILSLLSPFKIRRRRSTCTQCGRCARACPADIAVDQVVCVRSDECHACLRCLAACPQAGTLRLSGCGGRARLHPGLYAILIVAMFAGISLAGRATGYWQSAVSIPEYLFHVRHLELPVYTHQGARVPADDRQVRMKELEPRRGSGTAVPGP